MHDHCHQPCFDLRQPGAAILRILAFAGSAAGSSSPELVRDEPVPAWCVGAGPVAGPAGLP